MLISILTNRINQTLSLAQSLNLTNHEEQKLTIQLVNDLKKLLRIVLTKEEKHAYKKGIINQISPSIKKVEAAYI